MSAALAAGADAGGLGEELASFAGVRDRMEPVAEIAGVRFVNDTTATAPVATVAALEALAGWPGRIHLLAGGADKGLDPSPLADAIARGNVAVCLFAGSATPALEEALRKRGVVPTGPFDSMAEAVAAAWEEAVAGDVVLLSPGCASFGLFRDEFDRGDRFREAVAALRGQRERVQRAG
jgi:UDP-N-acetylmuramoylalanine--D-glutamate ligase